MSSSMVEFSDIRYEVKDAVARITINRPDKLNAFTPHTLRELTSAVRRAGEDGDVGVIVLTGAGERAFCAGGDVSVEDESTFNAGDDSFDELVKQLYRAFRECLKPVIARVDGYAIGGDTTWPTPAISPSRLIARCSDRTVRASPVQPRGGW